MAVNVERRKTHVRGQSWTAKEQEAILLKDQEDKVYVGKLLVFIQQINVTGIVHESTDNQWKVVV